MRSINREHSWEERKVLCVTADTPDPSTICHTPLHFGKYTTVLTEVEWLFKERMKQEDPEDKRINRNYNVKHSQIST
jgi:hypothetical protein